MTSRIGQERVQLVSFDDFEAYESAIHGWTPVVRKLDTGPFRGELTQLAAGPIRLAHSRLDSVLELEGTVQPGFQSFGLPLAASSPALWCLRPATRQTVSVYDASGSFEAATRPGFETVVLSFQPELLSELGEHLGLGALETLLPAAQSVNCDPGKMSELRQLLFRVVRSLVGDASRAQQQALQGVLEVEIPSRLLEALADRRWQRPSVAAHLRARALRRAREYIAARPDEPVGVVDLCRASGASQRTLRRAFTEHLGVPPKTYLRARRLNGVYRDLRRGDPRDVCVADVANGWGFWHMGQFAADYRRLFGELPSKTLHEAPVGR